jgi:hypothetical protein
MPKRYKTLQNATKRSSKSSVEKNFFLSCRNRYFYCFLIGCSATEGRLQGTTPQHLVRSNYRRFAFQTFTETPAATPSILGFGITHQPHEGGGWCEMWCEIHRHTLRHHQ